MPPPLKNWPPVARLSLSDQNGRTVIISTEGTVPGRTGKNKRQAAVSQIASWELFWGDGTRNGDTGPPPLELEHTYGVSLASAVIRLIVVDVNTLTATATMTITGLTGAPDAPQDVTLTVLSDTSIRVNWSDPSALSTSFNVERRLAGIGDFAIVASGVTSTSFIDTGLTAATAYEYRVQGFNTTGASPYSNSAAATTDPSVPPATPPAAPSGLGTSGAVFGQVTLTWTDNASDETGFSIERALSGGSFSEIATVQANTVTYVDLTVAASTAYQYRVRAFNAAGNSAYSNTASVTTAAPPIPAAPTNLVAVAQTTTSVLLTWTDNANNEANFELERRIGTQAFARIITLAPNLQSYLDPTAQPATIYQYRIRAINAAGASAYSNIATATTPAAPPPDPPVVVLTPNAVSIQVGTATILSTIGTHAGSAPLASYHLDWGDGFVQDVNSAPPPTFTRTYALPVPTSASTFVPSLRITDTNGLSATAFSAPITVNPPPPNPVPPAAPSNLTATLVGTTTARLNWTDNSTVEDGTKIERRIAPASFAQIAQLAANITTFDNINLSAATYDYRVRAFNAGGDSPFSNVASIVIPPSIVTYFIATTGNDTTGTGTQLNPWRTFNRGMQPLGPNTRLYARGGNYDERINNNCPSGGGTLASPQLVSIAAFPGETVALRPSTGSSSIITLNTTQRFIDFDGIQADARLIRVEGGLVNFKLNAIPDNTTFSLRFRNATIWMPTLHNSPGTLDAFGVHYQGSFHLFSNLRIFTAAGGAGAYAFYVSGTDSIIEGCDMDGQNYGAVHVYNGGSVVPSRNTVRSSRIHNIRASFFFSNPDTRAFGILFNGDDNVAYNNLIYRNPFTSADQGKGAIIFGSGRRGRAWNNTIAGMAWIGLKIDGESSDVQVRNNIVWQCSNGLQNNGTNTQQSNNLLNNTNPLFVDQAADNYQLQLGSPAIDAALTIAGMPAVDFAGVFRPQGASWDIGCYERVF